MPAIDGVYETALYVADLIRSAEFYQRLLGFQTLVETHGRLHALAVGGRQVLLLFLKGASNQPNPVPGGVAPAHDGDGRLHVAFAISADTFEAWRQRLVEHDVLVEAV